MHHTYTDPHIHRHVHKHRDRYTSYIYKHTGTHRHRHTHTQAETHIIYTQMHTCIDTYMYIDKHTRHTYRPK